MKSNKLFHLFFVFLGDAAEFSGEFSCMVFRKHSAEIERFLFE